MKIAEKLITFNNGQDVLEYFEKELSKITLESISTYTLPFQPVSLLLLDINMPILDGFETLKQTKELFKRHNDMFNSCLNLS